MNENLLQEKAGRIRDVIRYIKKFKNALIVIHIDDRIIDSALFTSHLHDISLLHESGLRVVIIPGSRKRIDETLQKNSISWKVKNGCRITDSPVEAMTIIKNVAFDTANEVMTSLAGEHLTAVIGNWVRARGKGVLNGIDYGNAGEIDKIDDSTIKTVLENGFIPIFPCIGWSLNGKPYNISSVQLASQVAKHLKADKLFYLLPDGEVSSKSFNIPSEIGLSSEGNIPAMNIEELDKFLLQNENINEEQNPSENDLISILKLAKDSIQSGVTRVHILNGYLDGTLPCEIFSDLGSGTMIYSSDYGKVRSMRREDIPSLLTLIQPFVKRGILLPRTEEMLETTYQDYIVYELDGGVRGCAALHVYNNEQAEIAAVAVDENCAHMGIGPKIVDYLINKGRELKLKSVFVMTTQTADWFEKMGFSYDSIDSIPEQRRSHWTPERGSKVLRLKF